MEYDFRSRFHLPLDSIGGKVAWGEAIRLVQILRVDPSSQIAAAIEGWDNPLSREGWMLADLIDVQGASKAGKKWKTYPRPIKPKVESKHRGNLVDPESGRTRTRAEVIEILSRFGHAPPV